MTTLPNSRNDLHQTETAAIVRPTGDKRRWWQLRVWHGMTAPAWFRLLWENRFAVAPARYYVFLLISLTSLFNCLFAILQTVFLGRRIERTQLRQDPIIILGHWRSGTTLLHELLSLDPRHHFPSTYACLAPDHFLVSQRPLLTCWLKFLMPKRRSQDNARLDLDGPQEDEWAICAMGLPSPYRAAGFPNRLPHAQEYLNLREVPAGDVQRWKGKWRRFLKAVSLQAPGKRLVLKSPLHTARVPLLLELFPDARFVHVVRDPREVFPSTMRLWRRLAEDEGLQVPQPAAFESLVLESYTQMYQSYEQTVHLIPPDRLCEIRYENLVREPIDTVRRLYQQLNLGDAKELPAAFQDFVTKMADFQTNTYPHSPEDDAKIAQHWGAVRAQLGYGLKDAA
jgi:hypothetical protein